MLPHAVYFETLGSIADESSPEWKAAVAGLVVLRLVDDWLECGAHIVTTDVTGLATIRTIVADVPEGNPVQTLLGQVVDAVETAEKASVLAVAPALLAYAQTLRYKAQYALERDVLLTVQRYAEAANDAETIVRTSVQLGAVLRRLGDFDGAEKQYLAAKTRALEIGDMENALYARLGQATTISVRGNLPLADSTCAEIIEDAERYGISRMVGYAQHERAHLAALRGDYESVVRLAYRALDHMVTGNERDRVLADLAAGFYMIGHRVAARDTNLILSACAQEEKIRWQATLNLMFAAAEERQEETFNLYRSMLQCVQLLPREEIFFHWTCAEGFQAFGYQEEAAEALRTAHALAERNKMQQFVFELEAEMEKKQPDSGWPSDIDVIADAIGEQLQFHTQTT